MAAEDRYRVIERDGMTGNERCLDNMAADPWGDTFTLEQAKATVAWRMKHISGRYGYEIRAVTVWRLDIEGAEHHDLFMMAVGKPGEEDPFEVTRVCVRDDGKPGGQVWGYTRKGTTSPPEWLVKLAAFFEDEKGLKAGIARPVN